MNTNRIVASALLAFLVACSTDNKPAPSAAPKAHVSTQSATRVHGDVVPERLVAIQLPTLTAQPELSASMPGLPKKLHTIERSAEPSKTRDFARDIVSAAASDMLSIPIDNPKDARVVVSSKNQRVALTDIHLIDSTGTVLDRARDSSQAKAQGRRVIQTRSPKEEIANKAKTPVEIVTPAVADHMPEPSNEAPIAALNVPRRVLAFDLPSKPGRVTIQIPKSHLDMGIELDIQQPNSSITIAGAPRELLYSFGDVAEVEYVLDDNGNPIEGANLVAVVELPNGERVSGLEVTSMGNGHYVAKVPLASADTKHIGAWHVRVKATGVSNGVEFERDMDNAFQYAPAHARIVSVDSPEIVRGGDGKIDEIKLDLEVDTVVDDRLGASAVLVYKDSTGEHSVGIAQTSVDLHPGTSTITLHFQATDVALSRLDGPFYVRDIALVSHAFATTQHRLGLGLDLKTAPIVAAELRFPTVFSPAIEESFDLGDLERP